MYDEWVRNIYGYICLFERWEMQNLIVSPIIAKMIFCTYIFFCYPTLAPDTELIYKINTLLMQ